MRRITSYHRPSRITSYHRPSLSDSHQSASNDGFYSGIHSVGTEIFLRVDNDHHLTLVGCYDLSPTYVPARTSSGTEPTNYPLVGFLFIEHRIRTPRRH